MGSNENATAVDISKPFSLRNYVVEARKQDIRHNWPFPEKCLETCVEHGIDRLLPPFESRESVRLRSFREHAHIGASNYSCMEIKERTKVGSDVCIGEAVSEITRQMHPLSLSANRHENDESGPSSDIALHPINMKIDTSSSKSNSIYHEDQCFSAVPSTRKLMEKRKKRKRKNKKRSMTEIYAEARPCVLEDYAEINGLTWVAIPRVMQSICDEGAKESKSIVDHRSESMITVSHDYGNNSAERMKIKQTTDDNEVNNDYHVIKSRLSRSSAVVVNRRHITGNQLIPLRRESSEAPI